MTANPAPSSIVHTAESLHTRETFYMETEDTNNNKEGGGDSKDTTTLETMDGGVDLPDSLF